MRLKENVRFGSNAFAMAAAMIVVDDIFKSLGFECIITSANDSTHSIGSLHYTDGAIDVRSHSLPSMTVKQQVLTAIKLQLNAGYDVLLENVGTDNEHYHIEFDPKVGK